MNQKDFIREFDFKFKKKFGQNFLTDDNILNNIITSSGVDKDTLVIEIGCGAGALTKKIVNSAKAVIGYEIDETLKPILSTIEGADIIFCDFLKRNIKEDISKYEYKKLYVIANLPYYITTPIITKVIEEIEPDRIVVMIQDEVADRLSATHGNRDYGMISAYLSSRYDVKKLFKVSRNCFKPAPNVDSAVISLDKHNKYKIEITFCNIHII